MPTYEYCCQDCGTTADKFFKIAEKPETVPCDKCGGSMGFIISRPAIRCDDSVNVPWIRDFARHHNRQGGKRNRTGGPPIETRSDYNKYLKDRNLQPCDSENLTEI